MKSLGIWFTSEPLPAQSWLAATSPGIAREREGYLLGAVQDEGLAAAIVEEFLGEVRAMGLRCAVPGCSVQGCRTGTQDREHAAWTGLPDCAWQLLSAADKGHWC